MKAKLFLLLSSILLTGSLSASSLVLNDDSHERFYNDFQKQIEHFFNDRSFNGLGMNRVFSAYPKFDMIESKDSYILKFELPGVDKKNIKVTLSQKNILNVSGVRDEYNKEEKDGVIRQERHYGSFNRSISLPDDIDSTKIDVSYKDGILSIKVAKDMKKSTKNGVKVLQIN